MNVLVQGINLYIVNERNQILLKDPSNRKFKTDKNSELCRHLQAVQGLVNNLTPMLMKTTLLWVFEWEWPSRLISLNTTVWEGLRGVAYHGRCVTGGRFWGFQRLLPFPLYLSLSACLLWIKVYALSYFCHCAFVLLLRTLILWNCKPTLNTFFHKLSWSWYLITAIEK